MFVGAHAPNAPFTQDDLCAFRLGGFDACKLLATGATEHTLGDVQRLRERGCRYFMVRLPDSVDGAGRWRGDHEYADMCIQAIQRFYPAGVRDYQLDNEPNLTWPVEHAKTWHWLLGRVIELVRKSPQVPKDVRLGLAPLSWKPATWQSVEEVWIPEQRKLVERHQFLCVHSYWQKPEHYNLPPFGGNVTHWHDHFFKDYPDWPISITEWARSPKGDPKEPPDQDTEWQRRDLYPAWLRWIERKPYVHSTFLYILGGTNDWRGFWPSDHVLRKIGAHRNGISGTT